MPNQIDWEIAGKILAWGISVFFGVVFLVIVYSFLKMAKENNVDEDFYDTNNRFP